MKIAVIGAGSWGTAIAYMLSMKHDDVFLWARNIELADKVIKTRENEDYLPGIFLPDNVTVTNDLVTAVAKARVVIVATPSHAVRQTAERMADVLSPQTIIVSASKGLELGTFKRMSEVICESIPVIDRKVAALSGPNHAEEVALKHPTTSVVACPIRQIADEVQEVFMLPFFRVYTNPDIIGVEMGGALKNIIALGAGIVEGLELGDNTKAALMTRGLAEIARLGIAMGAAPSTFAGLSGIGDLIVTCTSKHSRNRRAGIMIAKGYSLQQIQQGRMVVEGISATYAAYQLSKKWGIPMPITEQAYKVLYEGKSAYEALSELMTRGRTHEVEDVGEWKI